MASGITTGVASLRKEDVLDNLASSLTTDVESLRKKDVLDKLVSCLTAGVVSLQKKDVFDNLTSGLTTELASLRQKDVLDNLASGLTTGVASLRKKDVFDNLASRLTTDVASLRKKGVLDNLASGLTTNVASLRWKDLLDNLASGLTTNVASVCNNDVNKNLTPDLDTNVAHIHIPDIAHTTTLAPDSSSLPFPITTLPINLHCITCIDFTYHPTLWNNHATLIKSISPLLKLLISSFHLKYIFLVSHRHSYDPCPLEPLVPLVQSVISSWSVSTHSIFSHILGDNFSCSRSFLYLYPIKLSSPSLFIPQSTPSFPNPTSWLSPSFNTSHFSRLTTTNLINNFLLDTPFPLFFYPKFKGFVQQQPDDIPTISNSVVDHLHLVPEPSYLSCSTIFDEWFIIPFNEGNYCTHVCSPHPTEIFKIC